MPAPQQGPSLSPMAVQLPLRRTGNGIENSVSFDLEGCLSPIIQGTPIIQGDRDTVKIGKSQPCCEQAEFLDWLQCNLCTELSSIRQTLDKLARDVHGGTAKVPISRRIPSRSPPRTPLVTASLPPFTPRAAGTQESNLSVDANKVRKARSKIRFVSALVAASKRARSARKRSSSEDKTPKTPPSHSAVAEVKREISVAPSRAVSKPSHGQVAVHMMPAMWDSEAGHRMQKIQKLLNAQKSGQPLRMKIWQLTESPFSSKVAFTYTWITNILVIASVVMASLEGKVVDFIQMGFEMLFAVEFLLRLICCPHRGSFLCSLFNWADMLSIIPLGFRLSSSNHNKTIVALVPMLRLFKPLRRFEKLRLMVDAFSLALEALPVLLYTLAIIAIVFAEIIYFVEPRSNIADLPAALWFTIVTMTTVGYGDATPATTEGRFAASTLMIISALYMAMPLGIIGDAFSRVWADRDRLLVIKRFQDAFLAGGFSLQTFQEILSVFDGDGSGALDVREFDHLLQTMQLRMSEERITELFATLDREGRGQISFEDLIDLLTPKAFAAEFFEQKAEQTMQLLRRNSSAVGDHGVEIVAIDDAVV